MQIADIFVGVVCVAIGAAALLIAATNWSPGFHFWVGRIAERRFGRAGARAIYAIAGMALVTLGVAIARGFALANYLDLRGIFQ